MRMRARNHPLTAPGSPQPGPANACCSCPERYVPRAPLLVAAFFLDPETHNGVEDNHSNHKLTLTGADGASNLRGTFVLYPWHEPDTGGNHGHQHQPARVYRAKGP